RSVDCRGRDSPDRINRLEPHVSRAGTVIDDAVRRLIDVGDDDERRRILDRWIRDAEALDELALLKDESERLLTIDPRASLGLARALVLGANLVGRADLGALGMLAMGDALRALGQCQDALEAFDGAARTFDELGDEVGWARTRTGRLFAL